jgi:tetratricopeptide (TPR) repeat protein
MRGRVGFLAALLLLAAPAALGEISACGGGDLEHQAQLRYDAGDLAAATALRRRALVVARAEFGAGSAPAALAQVALARTYIERQRYLDAEPLLLGARIDIAATRGPADMAVAPVLADLARIALARGALPRAEKLARQAMAIAPAGAKELRVLGAVLAAERQFSAAATILEKVLALSGDDEAETARSLSQLADLYLRQDRYADALPLIEKAIVIDQRRLAPDHPLLAGDWYELGVAYLGLKRPGLAERVLRSAIDRLEGGGERATPRAANIGLGLARALHEEGRLNEARALFDRAQQILGDSEHKERRRERRT